jgi:hypothetical protein
MTTEEVFTQYAWDSIMSLKVLIVLGSAAYNGSVVSLPSWVLDWAELLDLEVLNKGMNCIDLCATAELRTVGNT